MFVLCVVILGNILVSMASVKKRVLRTYNKATQKSLIHCFY